MSARIRIFFIILLAILVTLSVGLICNVYHITAIPYTGYQVAGMIGTFLGVVGIALI